MPSLQFSVKTLSSLRQSVAADVFARRLICLGCKVLVSRGVVGNPSPAPVRLEAPKFPS